MGRLQGIETFLKQWGCIVNSDLSKFILPNLVDTLLTTLQINITFAMMYLSYFIYNNNKKEKRKAFLVQFSALPHLLGNSGSPLTHFKKEWEK